MFVFSNGIMMKNYIDLIKSISDAVTIPIVALGGAGHLTDFKNAYQHGNVSGIAAGSFFVYQGDNKGVLINYPSREDSSRIIAPKPNQ